MFLFIVILSNNVGGVVYHVPPVWTMGCCMERNRKGFSGKSHPKRIIIRTFAEDRLRLNKASKLSLHSACTIFA